MAMSLRSSLRRHEASVKAAHSSPPVAATPPCALPGFRSAVASVRALFGSKGPAGQGRPSSQGALHASRQAAHVIASASAAEPGIGRIQKIPITVITGFLGSGKTTTLNNLLSKEHGRRIAIIENEFGEIDIDGKLVSFQEGTDEQIMMLNNGCICCTVRGDLMEMVFKLYQEKRDSFDHLVIETTGLANPSPIIKTFKDYDMAEIVNLDSVVTVVDAKHISRHLDAAPNEHGEEDAPNEALEQVAYADRIVLNKTDLVTVEELDVLEERIRGINSMAQIQRAQQGNVEVDYLLGVGGFDLEGVQQSLENEAKAHSHGHSDESHGHGHSHGHSECDHDHGHGHGHSHDHDHSDHDHGHGHGHSHGHDHDHVHGLHNDAVSSVSMTINGDVDLLKINTWLDTLLDFRGEDLYRMKGILSIQGFDRRFVFQGVHHMFEGNPDREWKEGEERKSQIVFIGRELNHDDLREGFYACKADQDGVA